MIGIRFNVRYTFLFFLLCQQAHDAKKNTRAMANRKKCMRCDDGEDGHRRRRYRN